MKKLLTLSLLSLTFIQLFAQNSYRENIWWVTSPDHSNWLYNINEEAKITISVYEYGQLLDDVTINYAIGGDMMPDEKSGTVVIKKGKAVLSIGTMKSPGFKDLRLSITRNDKKYRHHIKLGFEPEKLEPYTQFPNDFEKFWEEAKEEAAQCPVMVEKTFVPEFSSNKVDCFLLKIQVFKKGQYVYGYLTIPKKEGKFPIVFSPPGAGIKPMNPLKHIFYAENGYIRLDMEIHGIRPDMNSDRYKEVSAGFGDYLVNGLDNRDNYYMKKVYLACVRAIDHLTALPEWDGKNLFAQGGSQGGALALITAGLDSRITACAANHPALSDMAGYKAERAGGYPHLFKWYSGMDTPEKLNTLKYYDVVNFAKMIEVPVFMTWGFNDNVCPPTTSYIVYNSIKAPKEALITPINEHWVSTDTRYHIMEWLGKQVK